MSARGRGSARGDGSPLRKRHAGNAVRGFMGTAGGVAGGAAEGAAGSATCSAAMGAFGAAISNGMQGAQTARHTLAYEDAMDEVITFGMQSVRRIVESFSSTAMTHSELHMAFERDMQSLYGECDMKTLHAMSHMTVQSIPYKACKSACNRNGNPNGNAANGPFYDGFRTPESNYFERYGQHYTAREIPEDRFGRIQDVFGHWEIHNLPFGASEYDARALQESFSKTIAINKMRNLPMPHLVFNLKIAPAHEFVDMCPQSMAFMHKQEKFFVHDDFFRFHTHAGRFQDRKECLDVNAVEDDKDKSSKNEFSDAHAFDNASLDSEICDMICYNLQMLMFDNLHEVMQTIGRVLQDHIEVSGKSSEELKSIPQDWGHVSKVIKLCAAAVCGNRDWFHAKSATNSQGRISHAMQTWFPGMLPNAEARFLFVLPLWQRC